MPKSSIVGGKIVRKNNPADRARKDARKKELKKNKKQRTVTRGTILKSKDPKQILDEMYLLDEQEFAIGGKNIGEENIVKDKKRKLKTIFDKIVALYQRENKEKYLEIKKWQNEYEHKKRNIWKTYYEKKREEDEKIFANDPMRHILPNIPLPDDYQEDKPKKQETKEATVSEDINHRVKKNKDIPLLPGNILPPGPPPVAPPANATPIPPEILDQLNKNSKPSINNLPVYPTNMVNTKSMNRPPPPPPPPPSMPAIKNARYYGMPIPPVNIANIPAYSIPSTYNTAPIMYQEQPYQQKAAAASSTEMPTVITADPKLRDIQADVTKLIPISVLRKREAAKNKTQDDEKASPISNIVSIETKNISTCPETIDVYQKFLNELGNI